MLLGGFKRSFFPVSSFEAYIFLFYFLHSHWQLLTSNTHGPLQQSYTKKRAYVRKIINYYDQLELEYGINYPERSHLDSRKDAAVAAAAAAAASKAAASKAAAGVTLAVPMAMSSPIDIAGAKIVLSDDEIDMADEEEQGEEEDTTEQAAATL